MAAKPHNSISDEPTWDRLLVRLTDIELLRKGSGWRLEQQYTDQYVLLAPSNGGGALIIGGAEYRLRMDTVCFCPPEETFGAAPDSHDCTDLYVLRFDVHREVDPMDLESAGHLTDKKEYKLSNTSSRKQTDILYQKEDHLLRYASGLQFRLDSQSPFVLCGEIHSCLNNAGSLERFRGQLLFQELLYTLVKTAQNEPITDSLSSLERSKLYMERNYNENVTIELLARMAEVSPKYYVELFKKTYGVSAMDYLSELRMAKAKQLMAKSDIRLREAAQQVGYSDEFYFSRKFKKETGVSPTVYMKSRRRKVVAYGYYTTGHMLALNMIPYAAPLHPKWTAYYYKMYRNDIPVHLSAYRHGVNWQSNMELLEEAQPDSVICVDMLETEEKEALASVAPVLFLPSDADWREHLRMTGEHLGISGEAEQWLASYDRKVRAARGRIHSFVEQDTFLIVSVYKNRISQYCNRSIRDVFFNDMQMLPALGENAGVHQMPLSLEQIASMDADRILVNVCQETESIAYWKELQQSALWQDLRAVRTNRVDFITSDPWREYSAFAHWRIVEEIESLIAGNYPKENRKSSMVPV
ncbi:ABC transporter substrate-binding protein [Paenibacillus turpanensis]|uniref:ABC transporter substrate-binding protein n=1 Tax=Paenibacillus turpanensis TaxID=2689078 RepID=UPI001A9EBC39|nr:AraC family transcriptional regulator [Paenibacillus turpanensis]